MKTEQIERFFGRVFITLIFAIVILTALELGSRRIFTPESPIERKFRAGNTRLPRPYIMFGSAPNGGIYHPDYFGDIPPAPKAKDEFRIFLLGGSTVLIGRPPLPTLLENESRKAGRRNIRVYNGGVMSSVSGMDLSRILFEVSDLHPDLVVMYGGGNDILSPFNWDPRPGYPFNFIVYENNPLLETRPERYPSLALAAYGSNLCRILFHSYFEEHLVHLKAARKDVQWKSEKWKDKIAKIYVLNLVKANQVAHCFHSQFIAFFQPMVFYKKTLTRQEQELAVPIDLKEYAIEMRKRILAEVEKIPKENSMQFVDLSTTYETDNRTIFEDAIHTTQESKELVAQRIYNEIAKAFR